MQIRQEIDQHVAKLFLYKICLNPVDVVLFTIFNLQFCGRLWTETTYPAAGLVVSLVGLVVTDQYFRQMLD